MTTALSKSEASDLTTYENVIREGLSTFRQVGEALAKIREGRLYRDCFKTFEGYCKSRWGFTRQRASQIILAAADAGDCQPLVDSPANERQARAARAAKPSDEHEATDYYEPESDSVEEPDQPTEEAQEAKPADRIEWVVAEINNVWLMYYKQFGDDAERFAFVAGLEAWQVMSENEIRH